MKLYHGTAKENIESILSNGLIASTPQDVDFGIFPERGGNQAGVSLAKTMATAIGYGDLIIEIDLLDNAEITEISLFNEILVNGNVGPSFITGVYETGDNTWIPENDVNDNYVVCGPVKFADGYAHVVEIKKIN